MVCIDNARVATCIAAAALAGASAAAFPSVAWADESAAPVASVPVPDVPAAATTDVGAVVGGAETDALGEAITTALDAAVVVDDAPPESPSPDTQDVEAASAPESAPSADPAAAPASAPEQPVSQTSDINGNTADTTGDTAAAAGSLSPTPAASHPPIAVQSGPSNLNVSVRVDSPGDAGAVTQVNIAAGVAVSGSGGGAATPPALASPSASASGSGAPVAGGGQPTAAISSAGSGATSDTGPADTWSWQWDCLSVPAFNAISPNGSTAGSMPANWTWIWNCGDNPAQYQGGTATQYQPVNMNVSIRISSPGNDGPVSQTNVAVAVGSGRTSPDGHTPAPPVASSPSPIGPGVSFPGISSLPAIPGLSSLPAVLSPVVSAPPSLVEGGDVSEFVVGTVSTFVDDPVELPFVLPALEGEGTTLPPGLGLVRGGGITDFRAGIWVPGTIPRLAPDTVGAAGRSSSVGAAPTSSSRSDARRHAKPAPRWRTPLPTLPAPESAPLGASAAASTGGGSSGGGLPVFLALPFLVALLDLARRVALERVASPSEHRSRMPDTPG